MKMVYRKNAQIKQGNRKYVLPEKHRHAKKEEKNLWLLFIKALNKVNASETKVATVIKYLLLKLGQKLGKGFWPAAGGKFWHKLQIELARLRNLARRGRAFICVRTCTMQLLATAYNWILSPKRSLADPFPLLI